MKVDFDDSIVQGTKWDILSALAYQELSPKQLAEKTWTTIGNVSQHLKILEAFGYVKKSKKDKGNGSRKNPDTRIKYGLVKSKSLLITIGPEIAMKKEIRY